MKRPLVILLSLYILGCTEGTEGVDCAPKQQCMSAGILSDPGSIDPAHSFTKQDQTVILDLLLGLTTYSAAGEIIPGLAESWTVSEDALTWTFKLRPAVWSDGAPITAHDVVFSMRRVVAPATGSSYANLLYPVVSAKLINTGKLAVDRLGVSAADERTVIIRLEHPVPYLPALLAHYGLVPVPQHAVKRWGDAWTAPGRYVSSGAYTLTHWRLGDRITLHRNTRFYDDKNVCLDRVDYLPTPNLVLAERRVKRGELDWHPGYDPARARFLKSERGMAEFVQTYPWTDMVYLAFNLQSEPLQDVRVRRALAMATDRDFIAHKLLDGEPVYAFVPPGIPSLPAAPSWADLDFDERLRRAGKLLREAGYTADRKLSVTLKSTILTSIPTTIAADWRSIGVDVRLTRTDIAVFFNDLALGDFDVAFTDWIADYPDATNFLDQLRRGHPANYSGYYDPEYESLLDAAQAEQDRDRRARLLQAAHRLMLEAAPIAPIWVNPSHNLVHPQITGWENNLDDVHLMRWMCWSDERGRSALTY